MAGPEFFQTQMGHRFYQGTMPALVRVLERIAKRLEATAPPAPQPPAAPLHELPGHWEEDPQFPVADWRHEVAEDNTRLGYTEWCQHRAEEAADEQA